MQYVNIIYIIGKFGGNVLKAGEKEFLRFLEGSDKNFIIPVYQRNYNWKKDQCKRLFDDLEEIVNSGFRTHFLGSVVSIYSMGQEYLIIDGQQRITTMSILLLAIYNVIKDKSIETKYLISEEKIMDAYLINKYSRDDINRIKLKPIIEDRNAYNKLFKNNKELVEDSNITNNYYYFYNRILEGSISVDDLFRAIEKLIIVEIELKSGEDDPQLIFESLNSTGLDLSEADRIRNFVLMGETSDIQEKFYNEYWYKIEKNTYYNVSNFIRDYLTIKERYIPNKNKVYFSFRKYISNSGKNIEEILNDLLKFSKYYNCIVDANANDKKINEILSRINRLEIFVSYPFLLEVFDDFSRGILNTEQFKNVLQIIESFILRRVICDVPTNALNKIFMNLGREIKKYSDYKSKYDEILGYILINKKYSQRFPDNEEFIKMFLIKDIYNLKAKNKLYLLERLENYDNVERVNVEELVNTNELNIEHIMPQTLNLQWKKDLGDKYEETYKKYIHTIGNITLTGYNSKLSNRCFKEKRDMEKGYKDSRLYLNKYLSKIDIWNAEEIIKRAKILIERGLEIWKYPAYGYQQLDKSDEKTFTLDEEDINFTGESVVSVNISGNIYKVSSWKEFYEILSNFLYDFDPIKFRELANKSFEKESIDNKISNESSRLRRSMKIAEGIYLEENLSTESKLSMMRFLLKEFDVNLESISFTLK